MGHGLPNKNRMNLFQKGRFEKNGLSEIRKTAPRGRDWNTKPDSPIDCSSQVDGRRTACFALEFVKTPRRVCLWNLTVSVSDRMARRVLESLRGESGAALSVLSRSVTPLTSNTLKTIAHARVRCLYASHLHSPAVCCVVCES